MKPKNSPQKQRKDKTYYGAFGNSYDDSPHTKPDKDVKVVNIQDVVSSDKNVDINSMIKEVEEEQKKRDLDDLKNKINPMYDISESVAKSTMEDLFELHKAIAICSAKSTFQSCRKLIEEKIDRNLKDLHEDLKNKELPQLTQANLSGWIIGLEQIKKELIGNG